MIRIQRALTTLCLLGWANPFQREADPQLRGQAPRPVEPWAMRSVPGSQLW